MYVSISEDLANHELCSTVVFTIEKKVHISEPTELKPMLFKNQLYCMSHSILFTWNYQLFWNICVCFSSFSASCISMCVLIEMYGFLIYIHISVWGCGQLNATIQFSGSGCPTLCNPMDCSMPDYPIHHQLPELTQTYVHQGGDAIQPSHPLLSLFLPSIFSRIGVFSNESVLHIRWPKY